MDVKIYPCETGEIDSIRKAGYTGPDWPRVAVEYWMVAWCQLVPNSLELENCVERWRRTTVDGDEQRSTVLDGNL